MKSIFKLFLVLAIAVASVSCGSKDEAVSVAGEWELMDMELNTKSAQIGSEKVEVYISFTEDGQFALYQMLGAGRFEKYSGTYTLSGKSLTGKYSDGSPWGNTYDVSVSGTTLTMTATVGSTDVYVYEKCTIPSDVK